MKHTRILSGLALSLTLGLVSFSAAAQLQSASASPEQVKIAQRLPKTVVVRISNETGKAEVLETATALKADAAEVSSLDASKFQAVDVNGTAKSGDELDSYVSRDSWSRGWNRGGGYGYGGRGWGGGAWGGRGWGGGYGGYGYNPGYSYYGYNYYYQPYYSYYNPYYTYYYYGW